MNHIEEGLEAAHKAISEFPAPPSVDDTLTVSGAAADAKVTGDRFTALTEEIASLKGGGETTETVTKTGTVVSIDADAGAEIKVEADTTEPVTLVHQGKNFLGGLAHDEKTAGGLTFTPNEDGTVTVVGTVTGNASVHYYHPNLNGVLFLPAGTYTMSHSFVPNNMCNLALYPASLDASDPIVIVAPGTDNCTFTLEEGTYVRVYFGVAGNAVSNGTEIDHTFYCQLELGIKATDYEQKVTYSSDSVSLPVTLTAENGENVIYTMTNDELTVSTTVKKGSGIDENAVNALIAKATKFDPSVWGLPLVNATGNESGMSKENAVPLNVVFGEVNDSADVKWQGSSSIRYPNKNLTFKFANAFEAKEGWGAQKKYNLKVNWIDALHLRNLLNGILWGQIVKSRKNVSDKLKSLPNGGAVDGFPVILMVNDEYRSLGTWNIPKDGWMYGMGSGTNEAIICADQWVAATGYKAEAAVDGTDFKLEYVTDENNAAWVKESINRLINACINSDGSDLDTTIAQYLDWESAIDYYILTVFIAGSDMTRKNYLNFTYDGVRWGYGYYDGDCTYLLYWDGSKWLPADTAPTFESYASEHRVMELIKLYKKDELKARYAELRSTILSDSNITTIAANFVGQIPAQVYAQNEKRWPGIPNTSANDLAQIRDCLRIRGAMVDKWIEEL